MCTACANADNNKPGTDCDGIIKPHMTLKQLISDIKFHASQSKKRIYRIYKKALLDPPLETFFTFDSLQIQLL